MKLLGGVAHVGERASSMRSIEHERAGPRTWQAQYNLGSIGFNDLVLGRFRAIRLGISFTVSFLTACGKRARSLRCFGHERPRLRT